ncbi:MAG: hypothetical protein U1E76_07800 [Planctomycetota bacterium]
MKVLRLRKRRVRGFSCSTWFSCGSVILVSSCCVRFQVEATQSLGRLDHELAALAVQRDLPITDLPEEEHRLAWRSSRASLSSFCESCCSMALRTVSSAPKKRSADQAVDALMRPEMIVKSEVVGDALRASMLEIRGRTRRLHP